MNCNRMMNNTFENDIYQNSNSIPLKFIIILKMKLEGHS